MEEIAPGLWHWTARHPHIGSTVSSYYLETECVLLDPMFPPDGPDWFSSHDTAPRHIVLSNRHHDRDSWRLRDAYGCEVHCIANGLHELEGRGAVTAFQFGDELPGGIVVHEVGAICPDECALHIPARSALAVADGAVRWEPGGPLAFVPDGLMDEPERTKDGLRAAYRRLCEELDFDHLLLAHGEPFVGNGHEVLRAFAA